MRCFPVSCFFYRRFPVFPCVPWCALHSVFPGVSQCFPRRFPVFPCVPFTQAFPSVFPGVSQCFPASPSHTWTRRLLGPLGGLLGASWRHFGASWEGLGGLLERSWGLLERSWGLLEQSFGGMLVQLDFWRILRSILERFWCPKGSQRESKMDPKTDQNWTQNST